MIIKFLGLHHAFFRPVLRRVLTVAVIAGWALVEYLQGNTGWTVFALALGAICVVAFFVITDPQKDEDDNG